MYTWLVFIALVLPTGDVVTVNAKNAYKTYDACTAAKPIALTPMLDVLKRVNAHIAAVYCEKQ